MILLLQIEDRNVDILQTFMDENKKVCNENNIKYVFLKNARDAIPPYWGKVFELKRQMDENPEIEYFMWLDSDAFFVHFEKDRFQTFLQTYEKYSFIMTDDMPPWNAEFNAGSFIVKNDRFGKQMMDKWMTLYDNTKWEYKNGKWTTDGEWAGENYEQGSFVNHILKDSFYRDHIVVLPYYVLNNISCDYNKETITAHLSGEYKDNREIAEKCMGTFESTIESFDFSNESMISNYIIIMIFLIFVFKKYRFSP